MANDLSKLSDHDVRALASGNMSQVSDDGLRHITYASQKPSVQDMAELANPITSPFKLVDLLTGSDNVGKEKEAAQGVVQGGVDLGEGLYNLADEGLHHFFPNAIPLHTVHDNINPNPKHPLYYNAMRIAPSFVAPEIKFAQTLGAISKGVPKAKEIYNAAKSLPYVGKAVKFGESLVNPAANAAAYESVYRAGDSNSNIPLSVARDMLLGRGAGYFLKGISHLTNKPVQYLNNYISNLGNDVPKGSDHSLENIKDKLSNLPEETYRDIPIADVAGSNLGQNQYKWLASMPFARKDAYKAAVSTRNALEDYANNVRRDLLGNTQESKIKSDLAQGVKSNYDKYKKESNELYDKAFKTAKDQNVKVTPSSISQFSDIPEVANALKTSKSPESPEILDVQGKPIPQQKIMKNKPIDVESAHKLRSDLLEAARRGFSNKNTTNFDAENYREAADAIAHDMENSGTPESANSYREAGKFYRNNVVPYFFDPTIYKVVTGQLDNPSNLSNILVKRESPAVGTILSHLTPSQRKLAFLDKVKAAAKSDSEGNIKTQAGPFLSRINNLDNDVPERLLTDDDLQKINTLKFLNDIATPSKKLANPPETGVQNVQNLTRVPEKTAMGYGAIRHPAISIPLSAIALGSNRFLAKLLRSQQVRDSYLTGSPMTRLTDKNKFLGRALDEMKSGANKGSQYYLTDKSLAPIASLFANIHKIQGK